MQALPQESGAGVSSTCLSDPPIPLTPTSSLTTSLRRLIGWLPGASTTMVHLEKESSPILAHRTKRWQRRKGKAGRGRGRGSVIIVVDLATGHVSVDNQRKINLQITKISLSHRDSPASSKHNRQLIRATPSPRTNPLDWQMLWLTQETSRMSAGRSCL